MSHYSGSGGRKGVIAAQDDEQERVLDDIHNFCLAYS